MRIALDWQNELRPQSLCIPISNIEAIQQDARVAEARKILKLVEAIEPTPDSASWTQYYILNSIRQRIAEMERTEAK